MSWEVQCEPAFWWVVGDTEMTLLATKMDAERRARELFPNESPDKRYARVFYKAFEVWHYKEKRHETESNQRQVQ